MIIDISFCNKIRSNVEIDIKDHSIASHVSCMTFMSTKLDWLISWEKVVPELTTEYIIVNVHS